MDEQIVIFPYNEKLLTNEKKQITTSWMNVRNIMLSQTQ